MSSINVSEVDIANLTEFQDGAYPLKSVNGSSVTLAQNNNSNKLNSNKMQEKVNNGNTFFIDQIAKIIKPTNSCKGLLYCTIACSVISYVLFIISITLPKWEIDCSFFSLKKSIFTKGIDIGYMIIIMILTIIDFIFLLFLLRLNHFYRKTYYSILICFGILVILKLLFEVIYLLKNNYNDLGSSFWLFTTSIIFDISSLLFYLGLIKIYENEIKTFHLNKQLEDFKKFGLDNGMIDSVTLVGSIGSQSQTQLAYNANKANQEKNIYKNQNQQVSVASLSNQPLSNNVKIDHTNNNSNYINIKNIPEKNVSHDGNNKNNNCSNNVVSNGMPPSKLNNINNEYARSISNTSKQNISFNEQKNSIRTSGNLSIDNISTNKEGNNAEINKSSSSINNQIKENKSHSFLNKSSTSKLNESFQSINSNKNNNNRNSRSNNNNNNNSNISFEASSSSNDIINRSIIRPKRDSSLMNKSNSQLQIPTKASSENKRISNSYFLDSLQEENSSKSQIIENTKEDFIQKSSINNNSDKNSSFLLNNMEPIYSHEVESLNDIEPYEEYSSIYKTKQANSIPTINSSSIPSQPKSQPPPQQHIHLPKPLLQQRPQSYQFNNKTHDTNCTRSYNPSFNSKKSATPIDDYIPLSHCSNTPTSSQIARKSQRDGLLNQIFGNNNDSHSYVSMTELTEKCKKETYQSFDQLTSLEVQQPSVENISLVKMPKDIPNEISNEIVNSIANEMSNEIPNEIPNEISNVMSNEIQNGIPNGPNGTNGPNGPNGTNGTNGIPNEVPNESFSQTLCHSTVDSYSQSYYPSNSNSNIDDSLFETLSYTQVNVSGDHDKSNQIINEKDLTQPKHTSISNSHHTSSIYDKCANINKYSVKSLQLKTNVSLNSLDPAYNERINSITINKYVNEEKSEPSKKTNFDILASSSMASENNPKEKAYYQEPYYGNSYYEKMPYYEKGKEYKGESEGKESVVSSLSISSSSSSLNTSDSSLKAHYKKYEMDRKLKYSQDKFPISNHTKDAQLPEDHDLSELPTEGDYMNDYYQTKEYFDTNEYKDHRNQRDSNDYSYSHEPLTPSSYEHQSYIMEDRHSNSQQNYSHNHQHYNGNDIKEDILNSDNEDEDDIHENSKHYYKEDSIEYEHHHHHNPSSISSSSSTFDRVNSTSSEEVMQSIHDQINYEREEDDYENQKPPVTVVTIPPLSPFELPAIAIPFSQPDPREIGNFSPIVSTQPSLTTRPTSYPINNHLSIPYDHSINLLNDYSSSSSYINNNINNINTNANININNTNSNSYNEPMFSNSVHSDSKLAADDLYSPNYYPRNSQPYPSSQSSSHHNSISHHYPSSSNKNNHWSSSEMSYTSQLIQRQKNNLARVSIHSMASNSSVPLKNKVFVENSGLNNTGNMSIYSNSNSIGTRFNSNSINNNHDTNTNTNNNNNLTNSNDIYYICKKKYIPQNKNELELNLGDMIEIYQSIDDEWCYGRNKNNKCVGAFPKDCLASKESQSQEIPNQDIISKLEIELEKLESKKSMVDYLEQRLQDPNLSNKDRELYQQHLDYLTIENSSLNS